MWFGKNIIAKLGLVLAVAVPALAADVKDMYPLKFGNLNEELQAQYWNDLMSFKMWGTDRIYFTKVTLTDKVGAVGTAGDFDWTGGAGFELGGPVLVEGNFDGGGQEFFTSGPARINGHMLLSGDKENNTLVGTYCVDGDDSGVTVNAITERACERGNNLVDEEGKPLHCELRTGASAKTGPCAEVKPVPKDLFIPTYPFGSAGATNLSSISVGNRVEHFIDVPPVEYDEDGNVTKKMYDYELSSLNLGDGAKFYVRIGSTKSLARFFVNGKISLTSSSTIQVVLVEGGNWDGSKWVGGDTTHVPDTSYAGNLLFYTNDDLKLPSMNGKEILLEGTFMSTKTIDIGSNLYLAGQFLAKEIKISNDLHGEGFRYVPFNASVVRTASGSGNVIVEGREDKVNIVLDKESSTEITFKYCFSFEGTKNTETDYAIGADVSYILVNNVKSSLPLYDPSTKTCSGTPLKSGFKEGSTTLETPIILYANPDGDLEHEYESFKIWILELEGAVLESGERNGAISLRIKDMDAKPNGADYDVNGTEDVPYYFDAFTVTNAKGDAIPNYSVKIKSLPSKGSLVLVDVAGKDSVVLEAGALIPSTAINTDSDVGKFVFRFEKDDYLPKEADNALERYNFDFWVVDGLGNISEDSYTAKVTVAPVNDAPVANDVEFTIKEKSVTTAMLTTYAEGDIGATDVENDVLTYSFDLTADTRTAEYYEHVAELYDIEPATGKIFVKEGAKLDYESTDSLLYIKVKVTDDGHTTADPDDAKDTTILVSIRMIDVNEPPTVDDPTFTIPENLGNDKFVGEVVGKDPDSLNQHGFEHLEYFIDPANTVANAAFKIVDPTKGNITVKNSTKLDYETVPDHKFEFDVLVRNCEYDAVKKDYTANCLEDEVSHVTVELTDVGEPPIIIPICEGDDCPTICQGDKCIECKDESCHEECVENCDKPNDPVDVLTVSVNENSPENYEIMRYLVRDEDFDVGHSTALTAEIKNTTVNTGAEDLFGAKMEKDADGNWNVVVYVADSSKLDYETLDFYKHDVTINVRDPEDADGVHGSLLRVIKVVDVNEAPSIAGDVFDLPENTPAEDTIKTLTVTDPDINLEYRKLKYNIIENVPFRMDSNNVVVTKKLNYEKDPIEYKFRVVVTDVKVDSLTDTAWVTVNLKNVNEKPIIIVDKGPDGDDDSDTLCIAHCDTTGRGVWKDSILTIGVRENTEDGRIYSETGKVLFVYHYADEDTGHVAEAKVFWFDSSTTIPSVSTKGTDLFKLDYSNGTITVSVKDEKLLDYEKLRGADSLCKGLTALECKIPDPEYTIGIVVKDPKGLADTLYRKIRVTDENEKPLFTAEPCVVVEGNHPGDSIGHVEHPSDIDSLSRNPALYDNYFKMTDVSHQDVFELRKDSTDLMRVILAALDSIDCEDGTYTCGVDSVYWVELTYGDTTLQTEYKNLKIPVTILDSNEAPIIKTDTIGVDENSPKGTPVDSIRWFDYDVFDKEGLHFEISSDPSGCFEIDPKTGFVTVKKDKCAALDHEKNPTLDIEVSATDMVYVTDASRIRGAPNTIKKKITVNVHDVNEPPHLDDTTFTVSEFKKPGTVIDTVVGHDPDTKNPEFSKLTYSMVKGDSSKFKVNPTTGEIVLLDSLDYETKNEYKIDVRVYDGEYDDVATITIKVKNEIEKTHVRIILVDDSAKVWNDPEVVYTNKPGREICWEQERDTVCQDIHITKDTVVTIEYKNPKKDSAGVDKVIIYYSNAAPMVTISAKPTQVSADNIFTILEKTGDDDSTVYVNDVKNNIYITIKDTANKNSKVDTSFKMPISLETVKIENKVYDKVESIIKAGVYLDETKPSKEVTKVPTNGNTVKVSYKEVVGKDTVTVTYETDKKGDVLKSKVIGDDGKEHSWEVITVSYVTKVKINGKEENVTISYLADAATGQVLEQDAEGNLMTATAAEAKRKEAKKNAAKADSTKNKNESTVSDFSTGRFSIAYSYTVKQYVAGELMESSVDVSYVVDGKGELTKNADGDRGYSVKYTYTNIFGNAAEQSLFIVLDQVLPTVEIRSPVDYQEIRSNYVNVEWYVNGKAQDTLTVQGLEKGVNMIVRFYRDKAGNEASDTVFVVMKDSKDIELSVVNPVTEINPDKVAEFYSGDNAKFAPEKGQTYSVSILSTSNKEIETLKGGSFDAKASGGEELYPDQKQKHLGPTLGLKVQLPVVKPDNKSGTVSGLATMDDLMCHGKINLEEVCNENTKTMGVEEYVAKYCDADVSASDDLSSINLYNSRITVKIWIYTSLGGFVDYYRFSHDLNEPDYTNEAGLLQMFFELKPDKEGFVRSESGKLYSTGAYLYKVQASVNSVPRCDVMPMKASSHKRGEKIKSSDDLLKPFGYKRPKQK